MNPDQVQDVWADLWAEPWKDPSLFPDCLAQVVSELGLIATGGVLEVNRPGATASGFAIDCEDTPMQRWAEDLIRRLHERARSGVPFGEPAWGDQPLPEDL